MVHAHDARGYLVKGRQRNCHFVGCLFFKIGKDIVFYSRFLIS